MSTLRTVWEKQDYTGAISPAPLSTRIHSAFQPDISGEPPRRTAPATINLHTTAGQTTPSFRTQLRNKLAAFFRFLERSFRDCRKRQLQILNKIVGMFQPDRQS
jgi:hypothetical protein